MRVFGAGHSFNAGVVSEDALVSLDDYSGLIRTDREKRQLTVKGGTRVRDVVEMLSAEWIFPLPGRGRGPIHHFFSEYFDWNEPPLFKNFLRIDASAEEVRIRCFAATGCVEHENDPPLEGEVTIPLR